MPPNCAILSWHSPANANDINARHASICTFGALIWLFIASNTISMQPCAAISCLFVKLLNAKLCNKLHPNSLPLVHFDGIEKFSKSKLIHHCLQCFFDCQH